MEHYARKTQQNWLKTEKTLLKSNEMQLQIKLNAADIEKNAK